VSSYPGRHCTGSRGARRWRSLYGSPDRTCVGGNRGQSDPRVVIEALNAGYGGDTAQKARAFMERKHWDLVTTMDDIKTDGRDKGEAAVNIGLKVVPTIYIFNQAQRVVAIHVGYDSSEHLAPTLVQRIQSLTAE